LSRHYSTKKVFGQSRKKTAVGSNMKRHCDWWGYTYTNNIWVFFCPVSSKSRQLSLNWNFSDTLISLTRYLICGLSTHTTGYGADCSHLLNQTIRRTCIKLQIQFRSLELPLVKISVWNNENWTYEFKIRILWNFFGLLLYRQAGLVTFGVNLVFTH